MNVGEMFAGIGGFRLGLEKASQSNKHSELRSGNEEGQLDELPTSRGIEEGSSSNNGFRIVWANDWNHADQEWNEQKKRWVGTQNQSWKIYTKHWNDGTYIDSDIREVKTNDIPNIDLLCAGFPCPTFSLAGRREGFEDPRGKLFFEVARIAKAKRPKLLLLENVRGLLSAQEGYCFWRILSVLDELGYDCEWKVLNSKHFGVPQNRERVFIVGHSREASTKQIFPITGNGEEDNGVGEVAGTLQGGGHSGGLHSNMTAIYDGHHHQFTKEMGTLTGRENRQGTNWTILTLGNIYGKGENGQVYDPRGISRTLKAGVTDNPNSGGIGSSNSPKILIASTLDKDGYLRTGARPRDENGKPQLLPIGYRRIRRLTPVECERLQGFPDGWTEGVSDTQRYKFLGNAVTVNVIEFLGKRLMRV